MPQLAKKFDEYLGGEYSVEWLYALLHDRYVYEGGELIRVKVYHTRHNYLLGLPAGTGGCDNNGYKQMGIRNKVYRNHQMIFLYHHGYIPKYIDHKNGDVKDNRVENLRECTQTQNNYNTKIRSDNISGQRGVSFASARNKWLVQLDKQFYGYFDCKVEAIKKAKQVITDKHKEFERKTMKLTEDGYEA